VRTYNNLYSKIYDFENLYNAYLKARRGHRYERQVLAFTNHLESELIQLQNELIWHTYKTGKYRRFFVHDPKTREVADLPFRDRVLQTALCNILEPLFEKKFIYDIYACRRRKGTHKGADRVTDFLRRAVRRWDKPYCLKGDIEEYYRSINHAVLLSIIQGTIACEDTLGLIKGILSSWVDESDSDPRGLPSGSRTSPLWANVYLNPLDHYAKEVLCVPLYMRYMDDFVIISGSKDDLWNIRKEIEVFIKNKLKLNPNRKTSIFPISHGVDILGYRIWPDHRLLRKRNTKKIRRALKHFQKAYCEGSMDIERINATIQSWLGHAKHADAYQLMEKLLSETHFSKGEPR